MTLLFGIFAIIWIVFNLPVPPVGGIGYTKLIVGIVGIILIALFLLPVHTP